MESKLDPASDESLASFLDALREIPNDEKGAYLTALARCPRLVQTESSVSSFLRHDRCDVQNAARRFVDYWEKRKTVFGHHRAFLPMSLTKGALSESCTALIRAGWVAPLPPDESGKRVCFLDMTIEETRYQHSHEDRLCCLFYALSLLAEDVSTQTHGFTLIVLYGELCYAPKSAIEGFEEILRVVPVQVTDLHLIPSAKMKPNGDFFEEFVPHALKTLLSSNESDHDSILDTRQHIYADEATQGSVLNKLQECGLRQENLPVVIGGLWTSEQHNAWMRLRLLKEDERSRVSAGLQEVFFPDSAGTTGVSLTSAVRRRRREAKHSRQKRDRKRCRVKALLLHIRHLEQEKRKARLVTEKLEQGLAEIQNLVKHVQPECSGGAPSSSSRPSLANSALAQLQSSAQANAPMTADVQLRALGILREHQAKLQAAQSLQCATSLLPSATARQGLSHQTVAVSANGPVSVVVVPRELAHHVNPTLTLPPLPSSSINNSNQDLWRSSSLLNNLAVERLLQDAQAQQLLRAQQQGDLYAQLAATRNLPSAQSLFGAGSLFR